MKLRFVGILVGFLFLFMSFNYPGFSSSTGTSDGNWTTTITYPTNNSFSTNSWYAVNFTVNETGIESCIGRIWNESNDSYSNVTGTIYTISAANDTCQINSTGNLDTTPTQDWNITMYGYNTTGNVTVSAPIWFRVDTQSPTITSLSYLRKNDTYNLWDNETTNFYQDYINISITVKDNSTSSSPCGVKIYQEKFNSSDYSTYWSLLRTLTDSQYFHANTSNTSAAREIDVRIPADKIITTGWQGRFNLTVYCTDLASQTTYNYTDSKWGVANRIESGTWTPIALMTANTSMKEYLLNLTANNISYMARYNYWNHTFDTHQWNQSTNGGKIIGINTTAAGNSTVSNYTTAYLYASDNDWDLLRFNNTDIEENVTLGYNMTNTYNWNLVPCYQTNYTVYITNTSDSCGALIDWVAWFNSSATSCAGGCWDALYNNGFGIGNESVIPFGTAYWALTDSANVTFKLPTYSRVGECA